MTPHVLVAGGGIGGLCLAHGLRKAGVRVTVFERTLERTDWLQGYRIHINPDGARALRECLPDAGWRKFRETVSKDSGRFAFMTEHMRTLCEIEPAPGVEHYGVSRIRLREVLLDGLGDAVRFGTAFERYEITGDRVTAHFADGSSATGDLLVGADGANSKVRGQLLPRAERIDTGVVVLAGKYPLAGREGSLPAELTGRTNMFVPNRGFMFTSMWRADHDSPERDYTFWSYGDAAKRLPEMDGLPPERLTGIVLGEMRGWSPVLRRLVAGSDPSTVNALRVRSAGPVEPWQTGPVTLLGDAIHSMTPMGGIGANTALRDALLLSQRIGRGGDLREAVAGYERRMLDYGFAAVRLSLRNARQAGSANRVARAAFRTALRAAGAVPAVKRRMFRDLGESPER